METMNPAEIKLLLFREIDKLPEELLTELKTMIQNFTARSKKQEEKKPERKFGSMPGLVIYMAPDFNKPLEFKE